MMSTVLLILLLLLVSGAIGYYFRYYKQPGYVEHSISLRDIEEVKDTRGLTEAQEVINSVKNRRESYSRRSSFEEASGDFVNLRNVKLSRAMSCESVMSDTSEYGETDSGYDNGQWAERKLEIPDIKTWLKNPTDFIRLSARTNSEDRGEPTHPLEDNPVPVVEEPFLPHMMISMSYLPTAERLSLVIVRLRLPSPSAASATPTSDPLVFPSMVYVKAYLVDDKTGKRTCKKKTSLKPLESPGRGQNQILINFNELMIFKLPIDQLTNTSVRVSVTGIGASSAQSIQPLASPQERTSSSFSFGHILIGSSAPSSAGITHFTTMTTTMRKPITMWHPLQQTLHPEAAPE